MYRVSFNIAASSMVSVLTSSCALSALRTDQISRLKNPTLGKFHQNENSLKEQQLCNSFMSHVEFIFFSESLDSLLAYNTYKVIFVVVPRVFIFVKVQQLIYIHRRCCKSIEEKYHRPSLKIQFDR